MSHFFFMLFTVKDLDVFLHLTLNAYFFSIPKAELNVVDMNSIRYKSDIYVLLSYEFCIQFHLHFGLS